MNKTLSLKREALASLTAEDLTAVAGAAAAPTTPVKECIGELTAYSNSICYSRGTTCAC